MKTDRLLTVEEIYLGDFVRPFADTVIIAKSFRGEGETEGQTQQTQQTQQTVADDPFKDVDLENLPDAAREAITKAKAGFASLQTEAQTNKQKAEANDALARQHQSRADRFHTELRKHNLDPDSQRQQQNAEIDEVLDELTQKFIEKGLTPEVAKVQAMLHSEAVKIGEKRTLKKVSEGLGGTMQSVGVMQVDRILGQAAMTQEYGEILQDQNVAAKTKEVLNTLVVGGNQITEETFKVALHMAVGELQIAGKMNQSQNQQQQNQQTRNFGNGGIFNNPQMINPNRTTGGDGAPIPKKGMNDDTQKAINGVVASMRQGLTLKKK